MIPFIWALWKQINTPYKPCRIRTNHKSNQNQTHSYLYQQGTNKEGSTINKSQDFIGKSSPEISLNNNDTFLPPSSPAPAAEHWSRTSPVRPTHRFRPWHGAGHGGAWKKREETQRKPSRRRLALLVAAAIGQLVEGGVRRNQTARHTRLPRPHGVPHG